MNTKLVVLGTALALSLTSLAAAQMKMSDSSMGMKSLAVLEKLSGKPFDIAYMSQMIAHHGGAIEMAQACVKNCKRPEVKRAAQQIISDQSREITQLTGWLKTWYNTAPDKAQMAMMRTDMKPMMDKSMSGMQAMEGTDKAFLEGMIPHHEDAVSMSKPALSKATRKELKTFAQGVIAAQTKEIAQFKVWLKTSK